MVVDKALIAKSIKAEQEYIQKRRLESLIEPDIRRIFNAIATDFRDSIATGRQILDASTYNADWESAFDKQYRRVGNVFLKNQRRPQKSKILRVFQTKQELSTEQDAELRINFNDWSSEYGDDQVAFVTETNNIQLQSSFEIAQQQAQDSGRDISNEALAFLATQILRRSFKPRVELIANMQTQAPAEQAKLQEVITIAKTESRIESIQKTWQTVGDEAVRIAHARVNGQSRLEPESFIVNGQRLKYPGDSSQGATISNIARCRCAAIYS